LVSSFFFSSRRRHTRCLSDWSSDVCSSDLGKLDNLAGVVVGDMHKCDYGDLPRDVSDWRASKSIEDVLEKHLEPLGVPVLYKLQIGRASGRGRGEGGGGGGVCGTENTRRRS